MNKNVKTVYLAIPYTWNADISFKIANEVAGNLMKEGYVVFSPISHSHPISTHMKKYQFNQYFWQYQDLNLLVKFDKVIIIVINGKDIDGYKLIENSIGCQAELRTAREHNIPIIYYPYTIS